MLMKFLFLDFETFYDTKNGYTLANNKLSVVEYVRDARYKTHGACVALDDGEIKWVSAADLPAFFATIPWERTLVIAHNAKFDGFILTERYGMSPAGWIDTKGLSKSLLGKLVKSHSLKYVGEYFGFPPKGEMRTDGIRDLTPAQESELAEYCVRDLEISRLIFHKLWPQFPPAQWPMMNWTVETFVHPKLDLNVPLLVQTVESEKKRKAEILAAIGIDRAVFASNKKFPELLKQHGYEVPMKKSPKKVDEQGNPVMIPALAMGDIDFLDMLESPDEKLRALCEARAEVKSTLMETRSARLARIGATGKWCFDIEFSGAEQTHRFSGSRGAGGNPQNFTRDSALREAVCAPEGKILVVGDYTAIERRMVMFLAKDIGGMQGIREGRDAYCDFASSFYGVPVTKEDKQKRRFGKTAELGLGYQMGPKKFRHTVRVQTGETIDEDQSERAVELYRAMHPDVQVLWKFLDNFIDRLTRNESGRVGMLPVRYGKEFLELPSGLKIRYPNLRRYFNLTAHRDEWVYDIYDKGQMRQTRLYGGKMLENISQALSGELCKEAAMQFPDVLTGLVHDEIHLLVPEAEAEIYKNRLQKVMETSPAWMPDLCLAAEVGYGKNWRNAK